MKRDLEVACSEREHAALAQREAEGNLRNIKKEMEAQELVRFKERTVRLLCSTCMILHIRVFYVTFKE